MSDTVRGRNDPHDNLPKRQTVWREVHGLAQMKADAGRWCTLPRQGWSGLDWSLLVPPEQAT